MRRMAVGVDAFESSDLRAPSRYLKHILLSSGKIFRGLWSWRIHWKMRNSQIKFWRSGLSNAPTPVAIRRIDQKRICRFSIFVEKKTLWDTFLNLTFLAGNQNMILRHGTSRFLFQKDFLLFKACSSSRSIFTIIAHLAK